MLDRSQDTKTEKNELSAKVPGLLDERSEHSHKSDNQSVVKIDTSSPYLPYFLLGSEADKHKSAENRSAGINPLANERSLPDLTREEIAGLGLNPSEALLPHEIHHFTEGVESTIQEPELEGPMSATTLKALMKDADVYAPVHNADNSTTYTIVQSGLTDRPGRDNGVDYYRRNWEITVPFDRPSLDTCKVLMEPREIISKDEYNSILARDKASNPNMELFAHGFANADDRTDTQALLLQLSSGRPTIALDWASDPGVSKNPIEIIKDYAHDTIASKRANDNPQFRSAIDDTVNAAGAEHTDMVGFSQGGFFTTRYLAHRVESNLPALDTVILTHPDVPIGAPELDVNGKPELLKDAANRSYVIGGQMDLAMKVASLASHILRNTPSYENGGAEERLGSNSDETRALIEKEGATPITEQDRDTLLYTQHFLNYAGIADLLNSGNASAKDKQAEYISATNIGRLSLHTA